MHHRLASALTCRGRQALKPERMGVYSALLCTVLYPPLSRRVGVFRKFAACMFRRPRSVKDLAGRYGLNFGL